jgi:hypothetical protein
LVWIWTLPWVGTTVSMVALVARVLLITTPVAVLGP